MEFKDRLKALRKEKKLTQVKLGEMLNYGYTAIANYESRSKPALYFQFKKNCSHLQMSLWIIFWVSMISAIPM